MNSEIDAEIARREVSHKRREKMSGDISECLTADSYIVTGFFTSDYHPIARRFAGQLTRHAISHWLYSWSPEEWQKAILAKPLIVKRAMQGFPGRTIILMDIDCDVTGPIYPVLECATDISLFIGVGIDPRREEGLRVRAANHRALSYAPLPGREGFSTLGRPSANNTSHLNITLLSAICTLPYYHRTRAQHTIPALSFIRPIHSYTHRLLRAERTSLLLK